MKTVLITGCSSGFGLETAKYFLAREWKVIATMRTPKPELFSNSDHLKIVALDVTNAESIRQAIAAAGPIDVLVNNAGIGMLNAAEGTSMNETREIFETNTFGTMAMVQAVLPQMRERKAGVIVNVTSTVTLLPLPLLAVYTASKQAVNAYTECLALELKPFNIRATLVLPGRSPTTKFAENAFAKKPAFHPAYSQMVESVMKAWQEDKGPVTESIHVAEAIWHAVHEPSVAMKHPAGPDAVLWMEQSKHPQKT